MGVERGYAGDLMAPIFSLYTRQVGVWVCGGHTYCSPCDLCGDMCCCLLDAKYPSPFFCPFQVKCAPQPEATS